MLNTRIDISPFARKVLAYESIEMELSLKDAASNAIIKGASKEAIVLAKKGMVEYEEIVGCVNEETGRKVLVEMPNGVVLDDIPVKEVESVKALQSVADKVSEASKKVPISEDPEAIKFINAHMDVQSGSEMAKALGRSKSSVNKWIAGQERRV